MTIKIISFLLISFMIYGCSTVEKIGPLPTRDQEFYLPKSKLIQKYPTIDKYEYHMKTKMGYGDEITGPFGLYGSLSHLFKEKVKIKYSEEPDQSKLPLKVEVLNSLGKPFHAVNHSLGVKGYLFWSGFLFLMGVEPSYALSSPVVLMPDKNTEESFERGNYCIYAFFERNLKTFYKTLMTSWAWDEKKNKSDECKKM